VLKTFAQNHISPGMTIDSAVNDLNCVLYFQHAVFNGCFSKKRKHSPRAQLKGTTCSPHTTLLSFLLIASAETSIYITVTEGT
jgi:hypothetical protein